MSPTTELLEMLSELYSQRDLLEMDREKAKEQAIPPEVKKTLDDIESEFGDKLETVTGRIAELTDQIKTAVIEGGATVKAGALQAVYSKPRVTWDGKKLEGMMALIPGLREARNEGKPSVSIRMIG